jgi:hypothetical protein
MCPLLPPTHEESHLPKKNSCKVWFHKWISSFAGEYKHVHQSIMSDDGHVCKQSTNTIFIGSYKNY